MFPIPLSHVIILIRSVYVRLPSFLLDNFTVNKLFYGFYAYGWKFPSNCHDQKANSITLKNVQENPGNKLNLFNCLCWAEPAELNVASQSVAESMATERQTQWEVINLVRSRHSTGYWQIYKCQTMKWIEIQMSW